MRARLANKYIFFEMLPSFLMGVFIFIFIILMFQSFRLTEDIIIHGAHVNTILKILFYLTISFLPVVLPMSLLFAVLLTYSRLSSDSEIIALKALGLNIYNLILPAILLGVLIAVASAQTSYYVAPWGNRKFEVLLHKLGETKAGITIKEGVFSEGFFDMVVYANKVDSKHNLLKKVFIYDERDPKSPLTIIAKKGKLIRESSLSGEKAFLRLFDGNIHKNNKEDYTKVDFSTFDINLFDPINQTKKIKTPLSYTLTDLRQAMKTPKKYDKRMFKRLEIELYRRSALAFACLVFALLGVGLGITTNKRSGKGNGMVLCIGIVVGYWIIYAALENLARSGSIPVLVATWTGNIVCLVFAFNRLRKATA